jgi:hypothetical protein
MARKQAHRRKDEERASAQRLAHGQAKHLRKRDIALQEKAEHDLDGHRIEPGDGR